MPIHHLRSLVQSDFEAVNQLMLSMVQDQIGLIDDLASHVIQSGGKRLRPLIVLLSSLACGYQGNQHITLAAMIEFFHTATLLHDDVVDESTLRRGRQTANSIWGSKASILVGDYLFTIYLKLMLQVGHLDIMHLLSNITHQVTCGEIKQLANRHQDQVHVEDYFEVIQAKTSLLFAASAAIGALISGADKTVEKGLYAYGLHLGNAFQLIDDTLDLCSNSETLGKNIGDDLADGKATLPILYALQLSSPAQQTLIRDSLKTGSLEHLQEILDIIRETNAIEYTQQIADKEINKALSALSILPDSKYAKALKEIAHFATKRDH